MIGRPGAGILQMNGQPTAQNTRETGCNGDLPAFRNWQNEEHVAELAQLWNVNLEQIPHWGPPTHAMEIFRYAEEGSIGFLWISGTNPAVSLPDLGRIRSILSQDSLFLVVSDAFMTETARLADVVLPAALWGEKTGTFTNTDRLVQLGRQALEPPGDARQDLWIIQQIAKGVGLDWNYAGPHEVFDEMRQGMPSIAGITWQRLEAESSVTYPCVAEGDPGDRVVFTEDFPTESGRGRLVPADIIPAAERPDAEYPMVLITGRQLEHWHTGSMTRRAQVLDAIEPEPVASIHPLDLAQLGALPGDIVTVESRRGQVSLYARADDGIPRGALFIPFCYYEAAANMLTNPALDPFGKIPEFKYCAIRVTRGGQTGERSTFGGGQLLAPA
jgi:formate dehydrogenase major subunit